MDESLDQIGIRYGTDKASNWHDYLKYYEKHLNKPSSLLEIGVYKGASMRMWKDWLPETKLYGLDLFIVDPVPEIEDVTWFTGDQTDGKLLGGIRMHEIEVIIDDGSHNSRDQWITFWALARSCKLYIIEDLHCCLEKSYRQGLDFEDTILGQMHFNKFPFEFEWYDNKIAFIKC